MQQSRKQKFTYLGIFVVLIGFLAFAILSSRSSKTTPPAGISKLENGKQKTTPTDSSSSSNTSSSTATSSTSQAANDAATQQLVASGPTETISLFVATVAVGTSAAHLYQRRKQLAREA